MAITGSQTSCYFGVGMIAGDSGWCRTGTLRRSFGWRARSALRRLRGEVDEFQPDLMLAESGALAPPNLGLDVHAVFGVVQLDYVASLERAPGANTNTTQRQIEDGPQVVLEELGLEPNRSPVL